MAAEAVERRGEGRRAVREGSPESRACHEGRHRRRRGREAWKHFLKMGRLLASLLISFRIVCEGIKKKIWGNAFKVSSWLFLNVMLKMIHFQCHPLTQVSPCEMTFLRLGLCFCLLEIR